MPVQEVYVGNDILEWQEHFGLSDRLIEVLTEEMEARTMDDLKFVYEDEELMVEVKSKVAPIQYAKFVQAKHFTKVLGGAALPPPPPEPIEEPGGNTKTNEQLKELDEINRKIKEVQRKNEKLEENDRKIKDVLSKPKTCDICFMIDCSATMTKYIEAIKQNITEFVKKIHELHPHIILRLAFVGYRDFYNTLDRFSILRFQTSGTGFYNFVTSVKLLANTDDAEDIFGALNVVANLDWSSDSRILFHIADAPCHGRRYHDETVTDEYLEGDPNGLLAENLLPMLISHHIKYYFGRINHTTDKMILEFNKIVNASTTILPTDRALMLPKGSEQYVITHNMRSETMMNIVSLLTTTKFSEVLSISSRFTDSTDSTDSSSTSGGSRTAKRDILLDTTRPDWNTPPLSTAPWEKTQEFPLIVGINVLELIDFLKDSVEEDRPCDDMPSTDLLSLKVSEYPFAKGEMRVAYYGIQWLYQPSISLNMVKHVILKESILVNAKKWTKQQYDFFLSCHRIAKVLSEEFNRVKPSDCAKITYVDTSIVQRNTIKDQPFMILEEAIEFAWEKYNNNVGFCYANPTPVHRTNHNAVQCFSHWTHHYTKNELMVVDCQGGFNQAENCFILTDPAIHFMDNTHFGSTNMAKHGMKEFYKTHKCNEYCRSLRLTVPTL